MNYIFVGCDSHDKTLVNRIALNREAAERKGFATTGSGRRKMIEYLKERSRLAGGAKVVESFMKIPEPTKTASAPSCITSDASAGVAMPPAQKFGTGSFPAFATDVTSS